MEAVVLLLDIGPAMSEPRPVCAADGFGSAFSSSDTAAAAAGATHRHHHHYRHHLDAALACAERLALRHLLSDQRRLTHMALLVFNSLATDNWLATQSHQQTGTQGAYRHISVWRPLAPVDWHFVHELRHRDSLWEPIGQSDEGADWLEAVLVAADHIEQHSQTHHYRVDARRVVLLTDFASGRCLVDEQFGATVSSALRHLSVQLNIIGSECGLYHSSAAPHPHQQRQSSTSCCDAESLQLQKSQLQLDRESAAARLITQLNHTTITTPGSSAAADNIDSHVVDTSPPPPAAASTIPPPVANSSACSLTAALSRLRHYLTRQYTSQAWRATLYVGTRLTLPVVAYARVKEAGVPPACRRAHKSPDEVSSSQAAIKRPLSPSHTQTECDAAPSSSVCPPVGGTPSHNAPVSVSRQQQQSSPAAASTLPVQSATDPLSTLLFGGSGSLPASGTTTTSTTTSSSTTTTTRDSRLRLYRNNSTRSMHVLGFTGVDRVPSCLYSGHQTLHVYSVERHTAFAALVAALCQLGRCAIVRRTYSAGAVPRLGVLLPQISDDLMYMVFIELPYSDDLLHIPLAWQQSACVSLTDQQLAAVDRMIDGACLTTEHTSLLTDHQSANPYIQRFYHHIAHNILSQCQSSALSSSSPQLLPSAESLLAELQPDWLPLSPPDVAVTSQHLRAAFSVWNRSASAAHSNDAADTGDDVDGCDSVGSDGGILVQLKQLADIDPATGGDPVTCWLTAVGVTTRPEHVLQLCRTLSAQVGRLVKSASTTDQKPDDRAENRGDAAEASIGVGGLCVTRRAAVADKVVEALCALRRYCVGSDGTTTTTAAAAAPAASGAAASGSEWLSVGVATVHNDLLVSADQYWPLRDWPQLCARLVRHKLSLLTVADVPASSQLSGQDSCDSGLTSAEDAAQFLLSLQQYAAAADL